MPKRKRSVEEDLEHSFERYKTDLFRALKAAKGFERQRLAKRTKDATLGQDKLAQLEQQVEVLKSLDLHQAAHAHLSSALLKVKAAAQSPNLPEKFKNGAPKPDISEEERAALHNVTSALYNRKQVRDVLGKAVPGLCQILGVPPPGEKPKGKKGASAPAPEDKTREEPPKGKTSSKAKEKRPEPSAEESLEQGDPDSEDFDDELDETAISRMEAMLGGSSSEDEGESDDEDGGGADLSRKPRRSSFDDDISLPGSDSVPEEEMSDDEMSEDDDLSSASESESEDESDAPPPPKKKKEDKATAKAAAKVTSRPTNSTFLPTLMGGYISGSESASDVDVAPPLRKNRRGQKARQAIWEKKYGEQAKHLGKADRKRDSGWDARRGAVEGGGGGDDGKPWKRGVRNPLQKGRGDGQGRDDDKGAAKVEKKRDDTGPLHPSWEAKKKAKQAMANASFQGKKITFD